MDIACPKCEWKPSASSRWACSCGHSWNTFDTAGRCPACRHVWRETQCLACTRFSPHADWYRDLPPVNLDEILEKEPQVGSS